MPATSILNLKSRLKQNIIRIENVKVPDGKFSVYDLRIFGSQEGNTPAAVNDFIVTRNAEDTRKARIEWSEDKLATGFIVNYGTDENKLYSSVMVYGTNSAMLTGLNKDVTYYYSIDAFNESGITKGVKVIKN